MKQTIALCGFKHVGKSTLGQALAKRLNVGLIDLDELITQAQGGSTRAVYQTLGEKAFRLKEYQLLQAVNFDQRQILCLGGGTLSYSPCLTYLREKSYLIQLTAPFEVVKQRVLAGFCSFIDPQKQEESFNQFYETRHQVFHDLAIPKFDTIYQQQELFEFVLSYFKQGDV
jgi:shikimate kinase